jgi:hypothetical protein
MLIKYPLLIPTFGHGATSLIVRPFETLVGNFLSGLCIYYCSLFQRKMLLIIFSIYHIADDFNIKNNFYKYSLSSLFHYAWLKYPLLSKCYLTLVHSPRHYFTIYKRKWRVAQQLFIGIGTSLLAIPFLNANLDSKLNNYLGELWYVAPIIAHIIVHSYYNKIININSTTS